MRSRYSKRIYSMKFGSESSDFIDDEDLKFLENLLSHHKTYINNHEKKLQLDVSILPTQYAHIYEKISNRFKLIKSSDELSQLYHNFDLRYEGEEEHVRHLREQIIHYLENKKHQILTNHRVEFLLQLALTTQLENLRTVCQEITSNKTNAQKKPINKQKESENNEKKQNSDKIMDIISKYHKSGEDETAMKDELLDNFSQMETLLSPYFPLIHPACVFDYDSMSKKIDNILNSEKENEKSSIDPPTSEIIEISDGEDDGDAESQIKNSDIDQMINYLIHRCSIQPDQHPSLLRDHQMSMEMNAFLLFVNYSIRFSLKYKLTHLDRRIFDCIFISSIIVGLHCVVYINERGINIERLTLEGLQVIRTRLKSVELTVDHSVRVGDTFSVLLNPDISRLVYLTLTHVNRYHDTGELHE